MMVFHSSDNTPFDFSNSINSYYSFKKRKMQN